MELINSTSVAVNTLIAESIDPERRSLLGIAKATFVVSEAGEVSLDANDPMPVYTKDIDTRYGVLPREDIPRLDPAFEVMVLGNAYAPAGRPVGQLKVSLQVGHVEQALMIFGERHWPSAPPGQAVDAAATCSAPEPFSKMPLKWDRAFGGTAEIEIDEDSFVDMPDPTNPIGRGFAFEHMVSDLARTLQCPDGYPRYAQPRYLPNIESPQAPIVRPDDTPLPVCWAPCEASSGIVMERMRRAQLAAGDDPERQAEAVTLGSAMMLHRAHPDWVIETPVADATVRLEGMTEQGVLEFKLPSQRVILDVSIGSEQRALELHPGALTLFPDLRKFTLVFRGVIPYRYRAEDSRTARVRLEPGWQPRLAGHL